MGLPIDQIRRQFPILNRTIGDNALVYLDWAATGQVPQFVMDAMNDFYAHSRGNVHRGMHVLSEESTVAYEKARASVQTFIHAMFPEEIIFTKSCTEAINLVAVSLSRSGFLKKGDAVVLSALEHHSNIVPWMQMKEERGIEVLWVDCDAKGELDLGQFQQYLASGNVKLLAITAQSNVLGVRPPVKEMTAMAHKAGALVLVDAAQHVAHHQTDVRDIDCDFLAFSGHKLYGPTGIGVLYGKKKQLQSMPPFLGGGMMIREVTRDGFSAADLPQKLEAGTPPIAEAIGLSAAIEWLSQFSWKDIEMHEQSLLVSALAALTSIPGVIVLGPAVAGKLSGCISFTVKDVHPHDLTEIVGRKGICLRAGHHCAQVLHKGLGIPASSRLSVGIPTSPLDIKTCIETLSKAKRTLGV